MCFSKQGISPADHKSDIPFQNTIFFYFFLNKDLKVWATIPKSRGGGHFPNIADRHELVNIWYKFSMK